MEGYEDMKKMVECEAKDCENYKVETETCKHYWIKLNSDGKCLNYAKIQEK